MPLSLQNKKIIISAGASGIGWATAKVCLSRGAYVYLCDIDNKLLKKTIFFITHDLDESLKLGDHIGILNHGKLVQVGTPIDIIMKPADDYVEAIVKDVNRAKVIKAKIIMTPANLSDGIDKSNLVKVHEDQFIDEFLPKVVCSNANCEIVDKEGAVKGYITEKELSKALTKEHMADAGKSPK